MWTKRNRFVGWGVTGGTLGMVVACGLGTHDPSPAEVMTMGTYHVDVKETSSTLSAVVADSKGSVLYTYEGVVMMDGQPVVKCQLMSNGASLYHLYPMFPSTAPVSKQEFGYFALYDYIATSRAYSGVDTFDNQGCDGFGGVPYGGPGGTLAITCTDAGGCCDTHDACYAAHGCDWTSWKDYLKGVDTPCAQCNAAAEKCVGGWASGSGGPGPSACCNTPGNSSSGWLYGSGGNTCGDGWGNPGDQNKQCLCPKGSESATPTSCTSSLCTGGEGEGGSGDAGPGNEGGSGDSGPASEGGSGDSGPGNEGGSGDSGPGNEGGSGDSGPGGEGGSGDSGYAFVRPAPGDRHHTIELAPGESRAIAFAWNASAGVVPAADLSVEEGGRPLLQVTSVDDRPFARVGLDLVPLAAGESYTLLFEGRAEGSTVRLVDPAGQELLAATLGASGGATVDVVVPGPAFHSALSSADLR